MNDRLFRSAAALGIVTPASKDELFAADEIVVKSSGKLRLHADHIDGKPIGGTDPLFPL